MNRWRSRTSRAARRLGGALLRAARRGALEKPIGNPVFIVGCGHSGTTLLLAMLSVHSGLHSVPYETSLASLSAAEVDWFVGRFNRDATAAGKRRWVEKTPSHVRSIGWLMERFPDAQVIVLRRDGRDVACSLRDRIGDLESGVHRWLEDNAAADEFVGRDAVHLLTYEELVESPDAALREVMEFLGEPFEPGLLHHETSQFRFYGRFEGSRQMAERIDRLDAPPPSVSGKDHRLYRSWQARQAVFDGRGRWRNELDEDDKRLVKRLAGAALATYGYTDDPTEW